MILDFTERFERARREKELRENLTGSGWIVDEEFGSDESEVCIYLIDQLEKGLVVFGCGKDSFPRGESSCIVPWEHFVRAWDVIVDPSMPFDRTHKLDTMLLALRSLPGISEWIEFSSTAFATQNGNRPHILVVIDRENMVGPQMLISAHSPSRVLSFDSIKAIIESYIDGAPDV